MILEHVEPFAWLVVIGPPMVGVLRAYSLDRFTDDIGTTVWRTGAAAMAVAFLVFASPWGLPALAEALADGLPRVWEAGLGTVYRLAFVSIYTAFPVAVGLGVRRRLDPGHASRRTAAVAVAVALFIFLASIYPEASQNHCPLFRDGLLFDGSCVVEDVVDPAASDP